MRSSSLLLRSYTIVFVCIFYSVYFHWVPYSLFWVIFSYYLSCYSTGKFSPFLSRNILHLFIGSLLLNLGYFFIICKKKLTPNMPLIHTWFTYSIWNMGEIFGLKFHLIYVNRSQKFLLKSLHAQKVSFLLHRKVDLSSKV